MRARVLVKPKAGILDPQGQAVERALPALGFTGVRNVHVGRLIELDVEEGGIRLIRLRDDGHGIHHDDLALALSRHATSKIRSFDDLVTVRSLGFRGEALPSISSVARLTLSSRTAGNERGWQLSNDGTAPAPAAHPVGTTVEVRLNSPDGSIDETISVKVPAGVDEGSKVRVRGKGQPGHGGRGDLIIVTHVQPHAYFKREGKDILLDLPVSASEAANGATVSVPTLEGRVELRIPAGITSGKRLRIRERGVPQRDGTRGDQYCRILVQLPGDLTAAEKDQLAAMDKAHGFDPRKEVAW